eukprot:CAMPEP_0115841662 /NCGR_PEP_ID=MMETSP0287-20121206/7403_1 /TAXON_ID=412157 /ORGANISM="Chrysochromulina rotalis, Strain UIO044" /LENGTH=134 /DNA_ID=CAMNT_0003295313 /DNA_START=20 /DNA_END=421 /DNA_ORIENTATION=+
MDQLVAQHAAQVRGAAVGERRAPSLELEPDRRQEPAQPQGGPTLSAWRNGGSASVKGPRDEISLQCGPPVGSSRSFPPSSAVSGQEHTASSATIGWASGWGHLEHRMLSLGLAPPAIGGHEKQNGHSGYALGPA